MKPEAFLPGVPRLLSSQALDPGSNHVQLHLAAQPSTLGSRTRKRSQISLSEPNRAWRVAPATRASDQRPAGAACKHW
jgi:hypothetical protein